MCCAAGPARAEMCAGEYQTGARRASAAERARDEVRRHEEYERSLATERARQAAEAAARNAELERRLALTPGARMLEDRCASCHSLDAVAARRHGWLGWWTVVVRMELLNGARTEAGERSVLVAHLAQTQPAGATTATLEWLLLVAAVGVPVAAGRAVAARARRPITPGDAGR